MRPPATQGPGPRPFLLAALASVLLVLAGCGPSDPLDAKVSAEDGVGFSMWRSHAAGDLGPEQLADFDQAVQAIRIRVMSVGQTSGSEWIEEGIRRIVDGKTVREVLRTGLGWKLELADAERLALEDSMKKNAQMTTRPPPATSPTSATGRPSA